MAGITAWTDDLDLTQVIAEGKTFVIRTRVEDDEQARLTHSNYESLAATCPDVAFHDLYLDKIAAPPADLAGHGAGFFCVYRDGAPFSTIRDLNVVRLSRTLAGR